MFTYNFIFHPFSLRQGIYGYLVFICSAVFIKYTYIYYKTINSVYIILNYQYNKYQYQYKNYDYKNKNNLFFCKMFNLITKLK